MESILSKPDDCPMHDDESTHNTERGELLVPVDLTGVPEETALR